MNLPLPTLDTSSSVDRKKLFTSFGSIRVKVVEAADCLDGLLNQTSGETGRTPNTAAYNIYIRVVISRDDGEPVHNFSTATFTYTSGVLDICAEEYLFDGISSTYNIIASLYASNINVENKCVGFVVVPIGRLEENITNVQWYQLNHFEPSEQDKNSQGLRSAIKMEVGLF